jgi:hypothetical protein
VHCLPREKLLEAKQIRPKHFSLVAEYMAHYLFISDFMVYGGAQLKNRFEA